MRRLLVLLALLGGANAHAAPLPGWPDGAVLRDVRFQGARTVREGDLVKAFGLAPGRAPDSLAAVQGVARLVQAFTREGWLDARVDSLAPANVSGNKADLVVAITTGPRHEVGSVTFEGLSRIDRHRKINETLAEELRTQVHALQLTTLTPEEAAKRM